MTLQKKQKGELGERMAEAYLQYRGFRLIERNWSCRHGEIDLIMKRGREMRFIEVKYRTNTEFGFPEEAITELKLEHIKKTVETYLFNLKTPIQHYQIDIISIIKICQHKPEIRWIEGV